MSVSSDSMLPAGFKAGADIDHLSPSGTPTVPCGLSRDLTLVPGAKCVIIIPGSNEPQMFMGTVAEVKQVLDGAALGIAEPLLAVTVIFTDACVASCDSRTPDGVHFVAPADDRSEIQTSRQLAENFTAMRRGFSRIGTCRRRRSASAEQDTATRFSDAEWDAMVARASAEI